MATTPGSIMVEIKMNPEIAGQIQQLADSYLKIVALLEEHKKLINSQLERLFKARHSDTEGAYIIATELNIKPA
jgi:hypothetical protein